MKFQRHHILQISGRVLKRLVPAFAAEHTGHDIQEVPTIKIF